ncbi:hypothetical protein ABIB40_004037 [Pedobacter sp. UYP30]|uniref:hypothetical protein n=1 Tax=Pedobacter sp. UYP30 TaxID=1756400 RepID=UPI00339575DA
MSRLKFFEDEQPAFTNSADKELKPIEEVKVNVGESLFLKYRGEQTVVTRINGLVANHAETKREFHVNIDKSGGQFIVEVALKDNIINFNPPQLEDAIALLCEVDNIKCQVKVLVDEHAGKIKKVLNQGEIIKRWTKYKNDLNERYGFVRDETTRKNLKSFIGLGEAQILDERLLIADLQTKLFFDVFFDRYLVNNEMQLDAYRRTFLSQLFDGHPVELDMIPFIMHETPETVTISETGKINKGKLDLDGIEKIYDTKYKPIIQYKFSEFDFKYTAKTVFNTKDNLIETAQVNIQEEVTNNVSVLISYSLKKLA